MIDLHNHILPGLDDGAADLAESFAIARAFVSEGVTKVAATPHINPLRGTGPTAAEIRRRVDELQAALDGEDIPLTVVPASEILMSPDVPELLEDGRAATYDGTRNLLVEFPFDQRPLYAESTISRLVEAGFQPVIPHPARSGFILQRLELVDEFLALGAVFQLTAPSLFGHYGPAIRRANETLLRRGAYSLAASDRHHPEQERSLAKLWERIRDLVGADTAELLLVENPARILADEPVLPPEAVEAQPSFLSRLFGG